MSSKAAKQERNSKRSVYLSMLWRKVCNAQFGGKFFMSDL